MLLIEFCTTFQNLYGKENLNMNLHLHGHLKECLLDFGPVYAFWLFGFERFDGILESYKTNCRDIPIQLMRLVGNLVYITGQQSMLVTFPLCSNHKRIIVIYFACTIFIEY